VAVTLLFVASVTGCTSATSHRLRLLESTPRGATFDAVLAYCQSKNLNCKQSRTAGFLNQDNGKVVGVKSIWSTIDQGWFRTVEAYWGFDGEGKLLDVWVWATLEGP
jgi:hypothetical protein